MAGMVGNKYQDMAKQIMAEMSAGAAPKAVPAQAKRKMSSKEMKETPKEENAETSKHEAGEFDPAELANMPAEQVFEELGLSMTPEDAQIYDEADLQTKVEMLDYLTSGTAEQGSLVEFENMVEDSKYGSAPTEMQPR